MPQLPDPPHETVDVLAVTLALPAGFGDTLRKYESAAAGTADVAGIRTRLVGLLLSLERDWQYAAALNGTPMSAQEASSAFLAVLHDAKARAATAGPRPASDAAFRGASDDPLVLATLVVIARGALPDLYGARNRRRFVHVLRTVGEQEPGALVAARLVVSPSDPQRTWTASQLASVYPELLRLDESTKP